MNDVRLLVSSSQIASRRRDLCRAMSMCTLMAYEQHCMALPKWKFIFCHNRRLIPLRIILFDDFLKVFKTVGVTLQCVSCCRLKSGDDLQFNKNSWTFGLPASGVSTELRCAFDSRCWRSWRQTQQQTQHPVLQAANPWHILVGWMIRSCLRVESCRSCSDFCFMSCSLLAFFPFYGCGAWLCQRLLLHFGMEDLMKCTRQAAPMDSSWAMCSLAWSRVAGGARYGIGRWWNQQLQVQLEHQKYDKSNLMQEPALCKLCVYLQCMRGPLDIFWAATPIIEYADSQVFSQPPVLPYFWDESCKLDNQADEQPRVLIEYNVTYGVYCDRMIWFVEGDIVYCLHMLALGSWNLLFCYADWSWLPVSDSVTLFFKIN